MNSKSIAQPKRARKHSVAKVYMSDRAGFVLVTHPTNIRRAAIKPHHGFVYAWVNHQRVAA